MTERYDPRDPHDEPPARPSNRQPYARAFGRLELAVEMFLDGEFTRDQLAAQLARCEQVLEDDLKKHNN